MVNPPALGKFIRRPRRCTQGNLPMTGKGELPVILPPALAAYLRFAELRTGIPASELVIDILRDALHALPHREAP